MNTPPFAISIIHYLVCGTGIAANSLLFLLVLSKTPSTLKSYSVLLACDSIGQFTTALSAFVLFTRVIPVGEAVFSVVSGPALFTGSREFCDFLDSAMIFGYSHYNVILVACFAFRYYVLQRDTPPVKRAVVIAIFVSLPSIILMILNARLPLETTENIKAKLLTKGAGYDIDGLLLAPSDPTNPVVVIGLIYACIPVYPAEIIVLILARRIYGFLAKNAAHMSDKTRASHRQIVKGLIISATLPILGVLSVLCLILGQLAIIESVVLEYGMHVLSEPIVAFSPIITIYFVQPYRKAVATLIGNRSATVAAEGSTNTEMPQKVSQVKPK